MGMGARAAKAVPDSLGARADAGIGARLGFSWDFRPHLPESATMKNAAHFLCTCLVFTAALGAPGIASAGAGRDLAACQQAVAAASIKYQTSITKAVDTCLRKMSTNVLAGDADTITAATKAAKACASAFRKLENAARPEKELATVFDTTVGLACDPAVNPDLAHAEEDTWTIGDTTLGAASIGQWCRNNISGMPPAISSFAAWRDCLRSATECEARQTVASRWPRALEYLEALKVALAAMPDAADALEALTAFDSALEGSADDNRPEIECAKPRGLLITGAATCAETDAVDPGRLADINCVLTIYPGQDGFHRYGIPFDYSDNGDGTVTDHVTGLTWEKLDDSEGIHDQHATGDWATIVSAKIAQLNTSSFAGHSDWRVPNQRELESLVRIGAHSPTVEGAFHNACSPGCSITTCSCTAPAGYWTSTPYAGDPSRRWVVHFGSGEVTHDDKHVPLYRLRAVRGGLVIP